MVKILAEYSEDDEYNSFDYNIFLYEFKEVVKDRLSNRKFPMQLVAISSNWKKQDGIAEVEDFNDLFRKIFSFGNTSIDFRIENRKYYFHTFSHDAPMGFDILIKPIN